MTQGSEISLLKDFSPQSQSYGLTERSITPDPAASWIIQHLKKFDNSKHDVPCTNNDFGEIRFEGLQKSAKVNITYYLLRLITPNKT